MFRQFLHLQPQVTAMPDYDIKPEAAWYGVKAMKYEGVTYKGKKTEIFSYFGYPQQAENEKVPAVVLVHGGGHAYAEWVKIWNERGFAALAMDLRGCLPLSAEKGFIGTESHRDDKYESMPTDDTHAPMPDGYCIYNEQEKLSDVWFYQAIANVILAHNVLLQDPRIDPDKIGITGVSWGGIITSQVIAHDKRFAFAIPIYGSAHLNVSLTGVGEAFAKLPASRIWNVGQKYADMDFPILWLCWNRDPCFDLLANSASYMQTKKAGAVFAVRADVNHSHVDGWNMEEGYRFAKEAVAGKVTMVRAVDEPDDYGTISFPITSGENVTATLYYLTEPMTYTEKSEPKFCWRTAPCTVQGNVVKVQVPADATSYYVEFAEQKDGRTYVTSTAYVHHKEYV